MCTPRLPSAMAGMFPVLPTLLPLAPFPPEWSSQSLAWGRAGRPLVGLVLGAALAQVGSESIGGELTKKDDALRTETRSHMPEKAGQYKEETAGINWFGIGEGSHFNIDIEL